jgi:pyridinium-3,5-biscarboxylic acid mononucleotide synthase
VNPTHLRELLSRLGKGELTVDAVVEELRHLPFREIPGVATVDHHRALRQGMPEVIFGQSKTAEQIALIIEELAGRGGNVLATRVDHAKVEHIVRRVPDALYDPMARAIIVERQPIADLGHGTVLIVTAGTADLPVAEEAALTLRLLGNRVARLTDVGVAGVHRILARLDTLRAAEVLIVIAGMEGALPSLVGGLVDRPVIAVPTSVGYGASFGGIAALLGMLTSCAAGVTVVNIDNGFGAAMAASMINRRRKEEP